MVELEVSTIQPYWRAGDGTIKCMKGALMMLYFQNYWEYFFKIWNDVTEYHINYLDMK